MQVGRVITKLTSRGLSRLEFGFWKRVSKSTTVV